MAVFNSRRALAFLAYTHNVSIFISSGFFHPCFFLLCISCLCMSNDRSSLFIHIHLLSSLSNFLLVRMHCSCAGLEVILGYQPTLLDTISLWGLFPWDSSKNILKKTEVISPEANCCNFTCCPASSSSNIELHNLRVTTAKVAPNLHISKNAFPVH